MFTDTVVKRSVLQRQLVNMHSQREEPRCRLSEGVSLVRSGGRLLPGRGHEDNSRAVADNGGLSRHLGLTIGWLDNSARICYVCVCTVIPEQVSDRHRVKNMIGIPL
jgi:hypothetical protein